MQLEYGGQRTPVAAGELLIGSDPAAGLRLEGPGVSFHHAAIRRLPGGGLVVLPTGAVVLVNGSPIGADPTPLLHGDRIGVGSHVVLVVDPAQVGATQMLSRADLPTGSSPLSSGPARAAAGGRLVCLNDGREYQVAVTPFVLGRDATAQVVIASPDASRRHAEIVVQAGGTVLADLSSNGTYVNGARVASQHTLQALDVIRIGAEEYRYYPASTPVAPPTPPKGAEFRLNDTLIGLPKVPRSEPRPPSAPPIVRPLATLLVKSGALKGQRVAVKSAVVNIGRAEYNEVRLPDASISSSHAKLQLREGVWTLTDLGSTNGTAVDGERVDDDMPLSPGAALKLGDVILSFEPNDDRPVRADRTAVIERAASPPPAAVVPASEQGPATPPTPAPARAESRAPDPASSSGGLIVGAIVVLLLGLAALVFLV